MKVIITRFSYASISRNGWRCLTHTPKGEADITRYFMDKKCGGEEKAHELAVAYKLAAEGYSRLHPDATHHECFLHADSKILS